LAVLTLEFFGVLLALALARILYGEESYPWSVVLATDFSVILFGAVLAELAAPSLKIEIETPLDDLISWRLTSLSVALTTLAPVAAYAVGGNQPGSRPLQKPN
jgi:hypothetical protein